MRGLFRAYAYPSLYPDPLRGGFLTVVVKSFLIGHSVMPGWRIDSYQNWTLYTLKINAGYV